MATTSFVLRDPDADEETKVHLIVRFHNQRLVYPTEKKIHPLYWNPNNQRVRETKQFPKYREFNNRFDEIEQAGKDAVDTLVESGIKRPTVDQVREKLLSILFPKEKNESISLLRFFDKHIETNRSIQKLNTLKVKQTTLNHLSNYAKARKKRVDFDTIDLDFYHDFTSYLSTDCGLFNNSVGKYIKTLKSVMNDAAEKDLHQNFAFKKKSFRTLADDTDSIYLTEEEINRLYELDLTKNPRLERVRDMFVIGCWVGLRYSDLAELRSEHFIKEEENNYIKIRTQKVYDDVYIPLHPVVESIIEKYRGQLPRVLSNQKANEYLKEIAKVAELNSPVVINRKRGNERISEVSEKWELVSTHTQRRSFATNLYLQGVPTITIRAITGHKTEKAFLSYIKVDSKQHAKLLKKHWNNQLISKTS
ncbi:site-specific integrase [Spirosoma radiotolerans]|uniref:Tyrosine type site-specific recombinase n=1 Tax=Spirosoma radiotolerans TaxID=1379870 RepID=A0A0E3V5N7_9BACT|nr:site-specific integrase [Spirosoma radiotolerans]AKD53786.1 tyrosine type site-specific recombinase [Spirosoma radiotolerans]